MDRPFRSIRSLRSLDLLNSSGKGCESFMESAPERIKNICSPLVLCPENWQDIMNALNKQIQQNLDAIDFEDPKAVKSLHSFIADLGQQKESGRYLTMEFKGRCYSIVLVTKEVGVNKAHIDETFYTVPRKVRISNSTALFEYIAETVNDFLNVRNLLEESFKMGISFTYPLYHKSIKEVYIKDWGKDFGFGGVNYQDVRVLLQSCLDRLGLNVTIEAVVNETVAIMASCAVRDSECSIGMIVGSRTNACYIEKARNIKSITEESLEKENVILNTDWGSFGDHGCLDEYMTEFDQMIDDMSYNKGMYRFEKMVGALHAGEICRIIMLRAIEEKLLFSGNVPEKLTHANSFSPTFLFEIDRDPPQLFYAAELILRERFKVNLIRRSDLVIVRYICRCVVQRAANLAGAACACLINRIGLRRVTVAVDGAYFRFSSTFPALLVETITQLVPYSFTFKLKLTEDGHARGLAAILGQKKSENSQDT